MSIMSDAPTPPNGGKWELTYWTQNISSHLPPLGGVGAFDMIDIRVISPVSLVILENNENVGF